MAVTVETFRNYLGLTPDNAENLTPYLAAAVSQARAAGIPDYSTNKQYDLFLLALAADLYDHRGLAEPSANRQAMINAAVLQLRYAGDDDRLDEEDATDE